MKCESSQELYESQPLQLFYTLPSHSNYQQFASIYFFYLINCFEEHHIYAVFIRSNLKLISQGIHLY